MFILLFYPPQGNGKGNTHMMLLFFQIPQTSVSFSQGIFELLSPPEKERYWPEGGRGGFDASKQTYCIKNMQHSMFVAKFKVLGNINDNQI